MLSVEMLQEERDELQRELAELEPKQRRLALIVELLKLYETPIDPGKKFTGMSVSEAILKFLEGRHHRFALRSEIKDALLAGGIESEANRFSTVVHVECDRLVHRGRLEKLIQNGKLYFRLISVTEKTV